MLINPIQVENTQQECLSMQRVYKKTQIYFHIFRNNLVICLYRAVCRITFLTHHAQRTDSRIQSVGCLHVPN